MSWPARAPSIRTQYVCCSGSCMWRVLVRMALMLVPGSCTGTGTRVG